MHDIRECPFIFFHPDFTVGFGFSPNQRLRARGLYRRSGISPCPEDCIHLCGTYLTKHASHSQEPATKKSHLVDER